jgi:hypothetical protein
MSYLTTVKKIGILGQLFKVDMSHTNLQEFKRQINKGNDRCVNYTNAVLNNDHIQGNTEDLKSIVYFANMFGKRVHLRSVYSRHLQSHNCLHVKIGKKTIRETATN